MLWERDKDTALVSCIYLMRRRMSLLIRIAMFSPITYVFGRQCAGGLLAFKRGSDDDI